MPHVATSPHRPFVKNIARSIILLAKQRARPTAVSQGIEHKPTKFAKAVIGAPNFMLLLGPMLRFLRQKLAFRYPTVKRNDFLRKWRRARKVW